MSRCHHLSSPSLIFSFFLNDRQTIVFQTSMNALKDQASVTHFPLYVKILTDLINATVKRDFKEKAGKGAQVI